MVISNGQSHYLCSFSINPQTSLEDAWSSLLKLIRNWITQRVDYNTALSGSWYFTGGQWDKNGCHIYTRSHIGNGDERCPQYWAVCFTHPCKEHAQKRSWRTDIGIEIKENLIIFSLHLQHCIRAGYFGKEPKIPCSSAPRIIHDILSQQNWECCVGSQILSSRAKLLKVGHGQEFKELLSDQRRKFPLILISPLTEDIKHLIEPHRLARLLTCSASVYYYKEKEVAEELDYCLGRRFNCWNGMVRIYQPKVLLDDSNDSKRHRYFHRKDISDEGHEIISGLLVRGILRRANNLLRNQTFSIEDVENAARNLRILELKDSHGKNQKESDEFIDLLMKDNQKCNETIESLKQDIELYQDEVEVLEKKQAGLEYQLKDAIKRNTGLSDKNAHLETKLAIFEDMVKLPQTAKDTLVLMSQIHQNKIHVTERAFKSSEKYDCQDIHILWQCLWCIATNLHSLFFEERNNINIEQEFLNKTGIELTLKEGPMTNRDARLKRLREDTYNGKTIDITPHIKVGTKKPKLLRIHFYPCHDTKKIVIGHCGDHIENRTSKSIR